MLCGGAKQIQLVLLGQRRLNGLQQLMDVVLLADGHGPVAAQRLVLGDTLQPIARRRPQSDRGRGTPVALPGAVARQGEPAYLVDAVDHDEHIDLILREQSHREAAYRRVEPVPIHRRGAVGQIPLHAARRLEQAELREPREELLVMVQSQRLAYRQQSGHRLQAVHLHGFAGLVYPVPVQPGDVVVLRIGVVVAALRVAEFVARQHHRCAQ